MPAAAKTKLTLWTVLLFVFALVSSCWVIVSEPATMGCSSLRKAQSDVRTFTTAVDLFARDHGRVPSAQEGLRILVEPAEDDRFQRAYMQGPQRDPWDSEYIYKVT